MAGPITRWQDHILGAGDHASRPDASTTPLDALYSCTEHGTIDKSDGISAWVTWLDTADVLLLHDSLTDVSGDQHHPQSHLHDGLDGSGTVTHGDLTVVGSDDHHTKQHAIDGSDHTGTLPNDHARLHDHSDALDGQALRPGLGGWPSAADATIDWGTTGARWRRVYTQRAYMASWFSEDGLEGLHFNADRLYPLLDATYDLGTAVQRWANGYFSGTVYAPAVEATTGLLTLKSGDNSINFAANGVNRFQMTSGAFRPALTEAYAIGTSLYRWLDGYFSGTVNVPLVQNDGYLTLHGTTALRLTQNGETRIELWATTFRPVAGTDATISLGRATERWTDGYFSGTVYTGNVENSSDWLRLKATAATKGVIVSLPTIGDSYTFYSTGFYPTVDASRSLGLSTKQWTDGYFSDTVYAAVIENSSTLYFGINGANVAFVDANSFSPQSAPGIDLGSASKPWEAVHGNSFVLGGTMTWSLGFGSPEGVVTASVGSIYTSSSGGAGTTLYVKESGSGNTGWVGK